MSLIARMIIPISVIVTLATSFIGWKAYSDARDSVAEATRILEISTLDAVGRELTTVMNLTRQHLLTVADRIAIIELLRNPDESPEGERSKLLTRHLRRAVLDFPSIDGLAVLNSRGTVIASVNPGENATSRKTSSYFHKALQGAQTLDGPLVLPYTQEKAFIISTPIYDRGKVSGVLVGAIDLKELIIARETTALDDILMTSYPYVYADELIEDCVERIRAYSEDSIPVLNADNRLCGALTAQVVAELVADELGEDYAKLGGLTAGEDLEEPLRRSVTKRLPWLVILLGLGLVVSSVVGLFERVVTHLTVIICFQSLVLDMAGNVGTQSLAVTIRVLMDEDVSPRQKLALVGKEARVGLMNGLLLGLLSFGAIGLYLMAAKGAAAAFAFSVSFCTGTALLVSMLLSSIIGTTVPILFKRLGVDPAVASGPLITTVNDLVAVTAYYGLAWLLLIEVLHF